MNGLSHDQSTGVLNGSETCLLIQNVCLCLDVALQSFYRRSVLRGAVGPGGGAL